MNKQSHSQILVIDSQVNAPLKDIYSHGRLITKTKNKEMSARF